MKNLFIALVLFQVSALQAQETDSLDLMIGQMIMAGVRDFYDDTLKTELLEDLESGKVGGIILFEKNILPVNSKAEFAKMVMETQKKAAIPLLVAIDEEGGRVNRLKPKYGFHKPPSAQMLGAMDDLDSTTFYSEKTAMALSSIGINVNFAPSVDVNINTENPIIGKIGRSFSQDYAQVATQAQAYITGHDNHRIATVLKHFPGHGSSKNDTHLGVADVSNTWLIEEIYPYKQLIDSGMVRGVMTSHVVNRSLDESKLPGTLSKKIVGGLLRNHLGFDGVVFTDDMQMRAIADHYGLKRAIKLAIQAEVDVLVFANNVPNHQVVSVRETFEIIKQLVQEGEITIDRIREAYVRVTAMKQSLGLLDKDYVKKLNKRLKVLY